MSASLNLYEEALERFSKLLAEAKKKEAELIIQLETFNDGDLLISLPKQVIDTVEVDFFVLADGEETVYYSEQGTDTSCGDLRVFESDLGA